MARSASPARDRTVLFLSNPALWPAWPFLPVVRRRRGAEVLGVVFDARSARRTGYSATVFITNLFALPPNFEAFLALPHETFDSAEELVAAGWCID
ncbi:hypothetical protein J8F10_21535 [Gemmata sp. G18]|uniref:Uncharacterized protein n=1 Tax=Gemmata palustris TaxID=2822762 RepID=A0ABS5BVW6_9BACT|nr:hypothetical protein [Gemmata palustris]MBP3957844.1 hypothetical protein [Gemmata palustris]